eukprot:c6764_g2_i2.p2 GENE.c6764_g2_i2~~c6764_g2_i2.p2  ORF type:complete len:270 (-),score=47.56 c6764_g2_i2:168-977(-)
MMHSKYAEGDGPCWAKGVWSALLRKRPGQEYWAVFGECAAFVPNDQSGVAQSGESSLKEQGGWSPEKFLAQDLRKSVRQICLDQVLSETEVKVPEEVLNGRKRERIWICGSTKVLWANGSLWIVLPSHRGKMFGLWQFVMGDDEESEVTNHALRGAVAYRVECAKCQKPFSMRNGPQLGKLGDLGYYHGVELLAHGYGWVTFTCSCSKAPTIENFVFPRDLSKRGYPLCCTSNELKVATACHISHTGQRVGSLRGVVRGIMVHGSFAIA